MQGQKITYNIIKQRLGDVLYKLTSQKFEDPCKCRLGIFCLGSFAYTMHCHSAAVNSPILCSWTGAMLHDDTDNFTAAVSLLSVDLCMTVCPLSCVVLPLLTAEGEDLVRSKLRAVGEELAERFRTLEEEFR